MKKLNKVVALMAAAALAAPVVAFAQAKSVDNWRNADGSLQDSERQTITPWALVRRRLLGRPETRVDWVNAAFWLLPRPVFAQLRGFDERFYLYCEDTDFCLRLQLAGWQMCKADAHAVHDARRASLKSGRFLRWHLQSLARLWLGPVQRRYLKKFRRG